MTGISSLHAVVTTIQSPTAAMRALAEKVTSNGGSVHVIGDRKGPLEFDLVGCNFYSLTDQHRLGFSLKKYLPEGHYARKNLGYLTAIGESAKLIYETDDDNAPLPSWAPRGQAVQAIAAEPRQWLNAYRYFSTANIWPRGFPLDEIADSAPSRATLDGEMQEIVAPVQQGLANGSPDVDAVWRLVLDHPVAFDDSPSLWLPPGSWCPFNSQSTWWWPQAYPLLYLPSHCSFRMTDIWRSFIAQRCLWELGHGLVFHASEVFQERNPHNLMRDFADEISGYLRNKELAALLANLKLEAGEGAQGRNLLACYRALIAAEFFPQEELSLVLSWLDDLAAMGAVEA
ncbi:MAG: DUF288 domain-containing protein [Gammaproteobacteria bacterium]|nr:DUF288 domain-containing protein [Gammaproteobacteria bacterium]